jgi:hypothetical protein
MAVFADRLDLEEADTQTFVGRIGATVVGQLAAPPDHGPTLGGPASGAAGRPAPPRSPKVIVLASVGCTPASRLAIRCKQQRAFGSWTHEGDDALQVVDGAELDNNAALAAT